MMIQVCSGEHVAVPWELVKPKYACGRQGKNKRKQRMDGRLEVIWSWKEAMWKEETRMTGEWEFMGLDTEFKAWDLWHGGLYRGEMYMKHHLGCFKQKRQISGPNLYLLNNFYQALNIYYSLRIIYLRTGQQK